MPDAIVRSVTVATDPDRAFRTWIERINDWWPKSHSRSKDPDTRVFLEGRVGGRFFERSTDGTEFDFGSVVHYEPPRRLAYHWYLGSSAEKPTMVVVRFTADAGHTRIDVEHRGPELIGEIWEQRNGGFSRAWDQVLPSFATICERMENADR